MDILTRKQLLEEITPNLEESELIEKYVKKLVRKLKKNAKINQIKCEFFIGGSFGKGTYLKGNFDVDIFCRFDMSYDDEKLSTFLEKIIHDSKLKYKLQKGSRDYFSGTFGGRKMKLNFEIIPVRKIKSSSQALNSTDYSPWHVKFVKDKILETPRLADEIRLAKRFFKAKKLYGAESYINGFSGHVIDILIIYYGSLENLLKEAKDWRDLKFIDINNIYDGFESAKIAIGSDKESSLVIIDPIINERNCARALSEENYYRFLYIANRTKSISQEDFVLEKEDYKQVISDNKDFAKNNGLKCIIFKFNFKLKNESEDIVGSKLKKIHNKLIKYYSSFDFDIFDERFFIDMDSNTALCILHFEKTKLPDIKKIYGPKVYMEDALDNFLSERVFQDHFIENSRVCVYEKRRVLKLKDVEIPTIEQVEEMINKDISFIKSLRVYK